MIDVSYWRISNNLINWSLIKEMTAKKSFPDGKTDILQQWK